MHASRRIACSHVGRVVATNNNRHSDCLGRPGGQTLLVSFASLRSLSLACRRVVLIMVIDQKSSRFSPTRVWFVASHRTRKPQTPPTTVDCRQRDSRTTKQHKDQHSFRSVFYIFLEDSPVYFRDVKTLPASRFWQHPKRWTDYCRREGPDLHRHKRQEFAVQEAEGNIHQSSML